MTSESTDYQQPESQGWVAVLKRTQCESASLWMGMIVASLASSLVSWFFLAVIMQPLWASPSPWEVSVQSDGALWRVLTLFGAGGIFGVFGLMHWAFYRHRVLPLLRQKIFPHQSLSRAGVAEYQSVLPEVLMALGPLLATLTFLALLNEDGSGVYLSAAFGLSILTVFSVLLHVFFIHKIRGNP